MDERMFMTENVHIKLIHELHPMYVGETNKVDMWTNADIINEATEWNGGTESIK